MVPTAPEGCRQAEHGWTGAALETARLRLRPLAMSDVDEVTRLLDDWEVVRNTSNIPFPYERSVAEGFIDKVGLETAEDRALVYAIEERFSHRLVGCVGATLFEGKAEIGYWFGRPYWGQGYATEALRRCLRILFARYDVTFAWATVLPENLASRRVLEKTDFVFDQRRRVELPARGIAADVDFLLLHRNAWEARRSIRPMVLVAAAALIDADGRVLLAQRPEGKMMAGQWEFPGGKVNPGETPEQALVRELREELGIDVGESCLAPLAFASHDYDSFHLLMPLYACRQWSGLVEPREGQKLAWTTPLRMADYPMPPADLPLVALLRDWL